MPHTIPAAALPHTWPAVMMRIKTGEPVWIDLGDQSIAELTLRPAVPAVPDSAPVRIPGALRGRMHMAEDFDSWPEDLRQAWGMDVS
jgi:hypothetical protein